MFEVFEHTADVGLRVQAEDRETLLVEAARGLFSLIVVNPDQVQPVQEVKLAVVGAQFDYLLFDWLHELLCLYETRRLLLCDFEVALHEGGLHGTVRGEALDPARHALDHEVKAVTYHGLSVREVDGQWQAEVILDI
jgi:SHS2 domain-containing protein